MSENSLNVLVVGTGDMAKKHIAAYQRLPDIHLIGLVGRNVERANRLCREKGIPTHYSSLATALKSERIDVASICVPTHLHPEMAIQLLRQGVHVLCEKPIALDLDSGQKMIAAASASGRKLSVVFNRRFSSEYRQYAKRIEELGTPLIYRVNDIRQVRPKTAMHGKNLNAGPVIDCAVHDFDLLHHLFGRVVRVHATGDVFAADKGLPYSSDELAIDTALINVAYENGNRPEEYWNCREFMGPKGIVRIVAGSRHTVEHYRSDGKLASVEQFTPDGHDRIVEHFVNAIRTDGPVPVGSEDALVALRVALKAMESIGVGEVLTF
jgi:predicted dehydrogenase